MIFHCFLPYMFFGPPSNAKREQHFQVLATVERFACLFHICLRHQIDTRSFKYGCFFEETTLLARGVSPGPPRVSSEPPKASPEFSDDLPRYPQSPPGYHQSLAGPPQSLPGLPRLSSESPRASPESLRSLARPPTWLFLSLFSPSSRPLVIKTSSEVSA